MDERHSDGEAAGAAESQPEDGLLGRVELIEAQPLADRAAHFDQLADELLSELQRSDHESGREQRTHP